VASLGSASTHPALFAQRAAAESAFS
jgi:hypothetical protein